MSGGRVRVGGALLVAVLCCALSACSSADTAGKNAVAVGGTFTFVSPGGATEIFYAEDERRPIGDFSGESLMNPGETIHLSDFDGQVVVLNVWGQWCGPCRSEVDDLQRVQEAISPGGTVVGINVRDANAQIARDFVEDNGVTYPSLYDPPFKTAAALGGVPASVIPTTIVLDTQHRPAAVFLREITDEDIIPLVENLRAEDTEDAHG